MFKLKRWETGSSRILDEVEVDMAPFIGRPQHECITRVKFLKSEFKNTFMEIEFKFQEGGLETSPSDYSPNTLDDDDMRAQSTGSVPQLEEQVAHLYGQISEYQRQVAEQRRITESLEEELARKDMQISVMIKQQK